MIIILNAVAYLADVAILAAYAYLARTGRPRPFHWANALGAIPLLGVEIATGALPVIPLTLTFGVLGALGLFRKETP